MKLEYIGEQTIKFIINGYCKKMNKGDTIECEDNIEYSKKSFKIIKETKKVKDEKGGTK